MTCILEIGDRRRLKAGIRVGHRAPCSGGRLNFAEAWRATSARPSPSEEDTPSSKNGKAKEDGSPVLQVSPEGQSVWKLLHQPHTPLSSGGRLRLRCPLRQGRPRRRGRGGPHPRTPGRDRAAAGRAVGAPTLPAGGARAERNQGGRSLQQNSGFRPLERR